MRFMMLYKPGKESNIPPTPEHIAEMGRYIEKLSKSGVLLATDGLQHSAKGARVRIADGRFTVTDGPFAEAKEVIGGFAILHHDSHEEAIAGARRVMQIHADNGVTDLEIEIRPMFEVPPCA